MLIESNVKSNFDKSAHYYGFPRTEMLRFVPPSCKSALDVGCGAGGFLAQLRRRGILTVGVEPNQLSYELAKKEANVVFNGFFNEQTVETILSEGYGPFDCIFFNDVLEHLENPWQALTLSKSILSANGILIASVPNFLFYSNILNIIRKQDFRYEEAGILDITHLRFFTRKSIVRMFQDSGYQNVNISGINSISSKKFELFNWLMMRKFKDWRYIQFAVVASGVKISSF